MMRIRLLTCRTLATWWATGTTGIRIWAPPTFALLEVNAANQIVAIAGYAETQGPQASTSSRGPWSVRGSWPTATTASTIRRSTSAITREGDLMKVIHVLAQDVGILGVFSDWPADGDLLCELHGSEVSAGRSARTCPRCGNRNAQRTEFTEW